MLEGASDTPNNGETASMSTRSAHTASFLCSSGHERQGRWRRIGASDSRANWQACGSRRQEIVDLGLLARPEQRAIGRVHIDIWVGRSQSAFRHAGGPVLQSGRVDPEWTPRSVTFPTA